MSSEKAPKGEILNRSELSRILGVTPSSIDHYILAGMPFDLEAGRKLFNSATVVNWLVARASGAFKNEAASVAMADARRREKVAQAMTQELKLATMRGEVVYVEDALFAIEEDYAVVKSSMTQIPRRVAGRIHDPAVATLVEGIVREEVTEALAELSAEAAVADAAKGAAAGG